MEGTDSDDYRAKRWVEKTRRKDEERSSRRANTGELAGKLLISINSAPLYKPYSSSALTKYRNQTLLVVDDGGGRASGTPTKLASYPFI